MMMCNSHREGRHVLMQLACRLHGGGYMVQRLTSNVAFPVCFPAMCSSSLPLLEVHKNVCRHTMHCASKTSKHRILIMGTDMIRVQHPC